jgi:hypothetical protein
MVIIDSAAAAAAAAGIGMYTWSMNTELPLLA